MKAIMASITLGALTTVSAVAQDTSGNGHQGYYVDESVEVSNHRVFPAGPEVDGYTILIRDFRSKVVRIEVASAALEPDTAYSIWLVAFNNPERCPAAYACTPGDLANPAVRGSAFWGGGVISDENGYGSTSLVLQPGRTGRELFANMSDLGLQDMRRAEIHIMLRSHGPTGVAGSVADQIGTAFLACPGGVPAGCSNKFASVHLPQ